ncbi:hypothetical protein PFLUV_G00274280 [Perca fluviatilis]|uniref:Uncharacterized protein n=1 Tax=Perca fluviatilis TaxID=8168 RepID=A0A6A5E7Q5_PERFL|nr:hypothetical protein PFLUV_G00274280 [Perca fluviatilis]
MAAFSTSPNRSNDLDNGQQLHSSWGREGQRDHGGQFWPSGQGSMVWLGGGLRWHGLLPFFNRSLRGRAAPDILLIHCGGNNLGCRKSIDLIAAMKQDLQHLNQRFPQMIIVLSDITQRLYGDFRRHKAHWVTTKQLCNYGLWLLLCESPSFKSVW